MSDYNRVGIYFEKEEKDRVDSFLSTVNHLLWLTLSKKQRKIYDLYQVVQMFRDHGMTVNGYLNFIEATNELMILTGLPFSLEADYAGLGSMEAWSSVSDKAMEAAKPKRKYKGKRRGK